MRGCFLMVLVAVSVSCASQGAPKRSDLSDTELAIIAAAVDSLYASQSAYVVIQSPTSGSGGDPSRSGLSSPMQVTPSMAADLRDRNMVKADLRDIKPLIRPRGVGWLFGRGAKIDFYDRDTAAGRAFGPDTYWQRFYMSFPKSGGLVQVSRPGIDANGQNAIIAIGRGCGGRCGEWGYALLRKSDDRWRVTYFAVTMRS